MAKQQFILEANEAKAVKAFLRVVDAGSGQRFWHQAHFRLSQ